MSEELFELPPSLSPRLQWCERVKKELAIFTNHCPSENWMAFSHKHACEMLRDYDLTDDEKTNPMVLFGNYCRLLDESGNVADNQPTEFDAIVAVAVIHGVKLWNEENL